jgi:membrane-associated phospholipid phosphatase
MHHPTDVVFGALGGGLWLALVLATLLPRPRLVETASAGANEEPESLLTT